MSRKLSTNIFLDNKHFMYIGGKSKIPNSLFWVLSWFADHV